MVIAAKEGQKAEKAKEVIPCKGKQKSKENKEKKIRVRSQECRVLWGLLNLAILVGGSFWKLHTGIFNVFLKSYYLDQNTPVCSMITSIF